MFALLVGSSKTKKSFLSCFTLSCIFLSVLFFGCHFKNFRQSLSDAVVLFLISVLNQLLIRSSSLAVYNIRVCFYVFGVLFPHTPPKNSPGQYSPLQTVLPPSLYCQDSQFWCSDIFS